MRTLSVVLVMVLSIGWSTASLGESGAVVVKFVNVDQFTDASLDGARFSDPVANPALKEIAHHLVDSGGRCLKSGQKLEIVIRDVDLAGILEWWHRRNAVEVRVLRDVDFPRVDLDFLWYGADGQIVGQGTERVADMSYLRRGTLRPTDNRMIPYEKVMLSEWLEQRFCPPGTEQGK